MYDKIKSLTPDVQNIVVQKGTEPPFSGQYCTQKLAGNYICRQCGLALFRSQDKFDSGCGWPSFDDEIPNTVKRLADSDGRRTEILCARCNAHMGHVFAGEGFTHKNIRHCVNSMSLEFVEDTKVTNTDEAIFAAGCFWGVEHYFKKLGGVLKTEVGYIGGRISKPTYEDVCYKKTGHLEAIRVVYDTDKLNYEKCVQYFFEVHDPTQANGQGPDIGEQYLSAVFYYDNEEKKTVEKNIDFLKQNGVNVVTKLYPMATFWPAESYHQDYYAKTSKEPYCHFYTKRF